MNYGPIYTDPETLGGAPVFAGTRVPVQVLFDYFEGGNLESFLENYPHVRKEQALAVIQMAQQLLTSEKVLHENFA